MDEVGQAFVKSLTSDNVIWQRRLIRSGYFIGAVLFHLVLFLMLATWIIFKAPVTQGDAASFLPVSVPPPPPPAPPASSGGDTVSDLEPSVQVTPPPTVPTVVTTLGPSTFALKAVKVTLPNLPASLSSPPVGTGLSGHDAPGSGQGAGSPFGSSQSGGSPELTGYLYDLKQTSDGQPTNMDPGGYHNKIREFVASNWDPGVLRPYYKVTNPLNTSSIFIPIINAEDGPKAFGVEKEVQPNMYCVWYKVSAAPPQDGTYHFVGVGDDILVVRVNGRTVLDGTLNGVTDELRNKQSSMMMTNFNPTCEPDSHFWIGTPFHASAGESVDIDVLIGEEPGGKSAYFLYIMRDEDADSYQKQSNGSPLLPVFQLDSKPIKPESEPMSWPPFAAPPQPWTPEAGGM
jgi:hypothetical protein